MKSYLQYSAKRRRLRCVNSPLQPEIAGRRDHAIYSSPFSSVVYIAAQNYGMKDCCMQCSDIRPRKSRTLEHLLQPFIDSFHNFGQLCLIRIFVENIYLWHDDTILYLASSQLQYFCTFPVRKIHHGEFFVKEFPISGTNAPFIFFFGSSSTSPCQGRRGEFF